jgi:hypothetical protein
LHKNILLQISKKFSKVKEEMVFDFFHCVGGAKKYFTAKQNYPLRYFFGDKENAIKMASPVLLLG